MRATDHDHTKRTDHTTCPSCEAAPASCSALHWLAGRLCCKSCTGNHDHDRAAHPKETRA